MRQTLTKVERTIVSKSLIFVIMSLQTKTYICGSKVCTKFCRINTDTHTLNPVSTPLLSFTPPPPSLRLFCVVMSEERQGRHPNRPGGHHTGSVRVCVCDILGFVNLALCLFHLKTNTRAHTHTCTHTYTHTHLTGWWLFGKGD